MPERRCCLVTGANAGIGWAAARQLAAEGHRVLMLCRDPKRGEDAVARLRQAQPDARCELVLGDLASARSIQAVASTIDELDVLVHNAAAFDLGQKARTLSPDGIESIWATNYLGPALLTELLTPVLHRSRDARVLAVCSKGLALMPWLQVDLDDPEFSRRRFRVPHAYYQSKLAHLAWALWLAEQWRDSNVRVHAVRVGNVRIELSRYPGLAWPLRTAYAVKSRFAMTAEAMARCYTWLATSDAARQSTGGYWDAPERSAPVSPWARNAANRRALATLTASQLELLIPPLSRETSPSERAP